MYFHRFRMGVNDNRRRLRKTTADLGNPVDPGLPVVAADDVRNNESVFALRQKIQGLLGAERQVEADAQWTVMVDQSLVISGIVINPQRFGRCLPFLRLGSR